MTYPYRETCRALGCDDEEVAVAVDIVVVYIQGVSIVVGVVTVTRVVVHPKPPVIRTAAVHEDPKTSVVDFRLGAIAVHVDMVKPFAVALLLTTEN